MSTMRTATRAASGRPVLVRGAAAAALSAVALAVVPAVGTSATGDGHVSLEHIAFVHATVTIRRGHRVTWTWNNGPYVAHNIHSMGHPSFHGATARKVGTYTVRFAKAGVYRYGCTLHPGMNGRVVVE